MEQLFFEVISSSLQYLTVQAYLSKLLEKQHNLDSDEDRVEEYRKVLEKRNRKLQTFSDYIADGKIESVGTWRAGNSDFDQIAAESCLYFKQSLEFIRSLKVLSDLTGPLNEYYSLLQSVKGIILSNFDINRRYFSYHGLVCQPDPDDYLVIKVPKRNSVGVFQGLVLMYENETEFKRYLSGSFSITFREALSPFLNNPSLSSTLAEIYVCSFALSALVRYYPKKLNTIIAGVDDDIIRGIWNFRNSIFPDSFINLLKLRFFFPSDRIADKW